MLSVLLIIVVIICLYNFFSEFDDAVVEENTRIAEYDTEWEEEYENRSRQDGI